MSLRAAVFPANSRQYRVVSREVIVSACARVMWGGYWYSNAALGPWCVLEQPGEMEPCNTRDHVPFTFCKRQCLIPSYLQNSHMRHFDFLDNKGLVLYVRLGIQLTLMVTTIVEFWLNSSRVSMARLVIHFVLSRTRSLTSCRR